MFESRKSVALIGAMSFALSAWTAADANRSVHALFDTEFTANLDGASLRPEQVRTTATGTGRFVHSGVSITYSLSVRQLSSRPIAVHLHGPSDANGTAAVLTTLGPIDTVTTGALVRGTITAMPGSVVSVDSLRALMAAGRAYVDVHTKNHPDGEIRGQFGR